MQSPPWIALLKKLPAETHNNLMLLTTNGTEITIHTILLLEGDCLVFKGRLSGSQDAGRVFYVPYDRIDFLGFNRAVTEEEFRTWYGNNPPAAAEPATPSTVNGNGNANGATYADAATSGVRSALPNRAALLERIRSRPSLHGGEGLGSSVDRGS